MARAVSDPDFHVYSTAAPVRHFLSVLPESLLGDRALPSEAIVGELKGGAERITPDTFVPNNRFMAFLHWVIARHAATHPDLVETARRQGNGDVTLVDRRTTQPEGKVPPEDVLGVFEVKDGKVLRYRVNPRHALLTEHGLFELDPWFQDRLLDELKLILAA